MRGAALAVRSSQEPAASLQAREWILKQVQDDGVGR